MDTNVKKRTETDRSCQTHTEMVRIGQNRLETDKKNKEYGKKLTETERNWEKKTETEINGQKLTEIVRNKQIWT